MCHYWPNLRGFSPTHWSAEGNRRSYSRHDAKYIEITSYYTCLDLLVTCLEFRIYVQCLLKETMTCFVTHYENFKIIHTFERNVSFIIYSTFFVLIIDFFGYFEELPKVDPNLDTDPKINTYLWIRLRSKELMNPCWSVYGPAALICMILANTVPLNTIFSQGTGIKVSFRKLIKITGQLNISKNKQTQRKPLNWLKNRRECPNVMRFASLHHGLQK